MKLHYQFHNPFSRLFNLSQAILLLACSGGCSKKEDTVEPLPAFYTYSATLLDSVQRQPLAHMKARLVRMEGSAGFIGPWWQFNTYSRKWETILDSFYTDSSGTFSFTIDRYQKENSRLELRFELPSAYRPLAVDNGGFHRFTQTGVLHAHPWSYLIVDIANFWSKYCTYYQLEAVDLADTTWPQTIVYYNHGQTLGFNAAPFIKPIKSGKYEFRAKYIDWYSQGTKKVTRELAPYDTLVMSTLMK